MTNLTNLNSNIVNSNLNNDDSDSNNRSNNLFSKLFDPIVQFISKHYRWFMIAYVAVKLVDTYLFDYSETIIKLDNSLIVTFYLTLTAMAGISIYYLLKKDNRCDNTVSNGESKKSESMIVDIDSKTNNTASNSTASNTNSTASNMTDNTSVNNIVDNTIQSQQYNKLLAITFIIYLIIVTVIEIMSYQYRLDNNLSSPIVIIRPMFVMIPIIIELRKLIFS